MRARIRGVVFLAAALYAVVSLGSTSQDDQKSPPTPPEASKAEQQTPPAPPVVPDGEQKPKPPVVSEEMTVTETTDNLIYSVNRTPERTFDTSRAVTVVTGDEIRRTNASGLAEVLDEQVGLVVSSRATGGTPIMRGLSGKQVMILIDGVKVNSATWGGLEREYLNMIALDQVDRIEIVRGVVSVLGTESLGGVINIVTKKGGPGTAFSGSIGARWSGGDQGFRSPLQIHSNVGKLHMTAGISGMRKGDLRGGGDVESQNTSFAQTDGYVNGHIVLSDERLIGFGYQNVQQGDVKWPAPNEGISNERQFQLASLSYQDLTSRAWSDSLTARVFWNNQEQGAWFEFGDPDLKLFDGDILYGGSIEVGKFVGSHHLVYGVDYARDRVESWGFGPPFGPGSGEPQDLRGVNMNGSRYTMFGAYLQDHFKPWKWLTVVAGARYGRFSTSGEEVTFLGPLTLDNHKSDFTGALNLTAHVNPYVNVIANAFRGFRAPNINDVSRFAFVFSPAGVGVQVPNANAEAEHVMSYEGGVKYERKGLSGSAFVFRNELTNLLAVGKIGFQDGNQNGLQDPFEFEILTNRNVGEAVIRGYEVETRYTAANGVSVWAHYATSEATDSTTGEPLAFVPGGAGGAGIRYAPAWKRRPWAQLTWRHQSAQTNLTATEELAPGYADAFNVLHIRGGFELHKTISALVGIENVFDEKYRDMDPFTTIYGAGRQVVLGLVYNF